MQESAQKRILQAFFVVLRPVARILLRYGVGFREFAEVAKSAFVDVATSDYGIRGRPTNISRVAVMTGLTRKEVRRIRDQLGSDGQQFSVKSAPLAHVLTKWFTEKDFLGSDGRPLKLPFAGGEKSFTELVRRFGGDIPPGAMRTELNRVGAIKEDEDGNIEAVRRDVHPTVTLDNLCMTLLHGAYPLLSNIAHNTDPNLSEETWTQMTAYSSEIPQSDLIRLRRICKDRSKNAMESYDDLFSAYSTGHEVKAKEDPPRTAAIGVFYFEESAKDSYSIWKSANEN